MPLILLQPETEAILSSCHRWDISYLLAVKLKSFSPYVVYKRLKNSKRNNILRWTLRIISVNIFRYENINYSWSCYDIKKIVSMDTDNYTSTHRQFGTKVFLSKNKSNWQELSTAMTCDPRHSSLAIWVISTVKYRGRVIKYFQMWSLTEFLHNICICVRSLFPYMNNFLFAYFVSNFICNVKHS